MKLIKRLWHFFCDTRAPDNVQPHYVGNDEELVPDRKQRNPGARVLAPARAVQRNSSLLNACVARD